MPQSISRDILQSLWEYDPSRLCNHHEDCIDSIFDGGYQNLNNVNCCVLHNVQSLHPDKYLGLKSIMKRITFYRTDKPSHGICIIVRFALIEFHFAVFGKEGSQQAAASSQIAAGPGRWWIVGCRRWREVMLIISQRVGWLFVEWTSTWLPWVGCYHER